MNGPSTNWGHPVAYHPMLSHFFGSVNAAIFFCQLRYWGDRTVNPLGVYKTSEEWTTETGLSYREQATARRILSDPGFVIETNKRLEHRIYFLIDWSAFNPAFEAWLDKNPPAPITRTTNCAKRISPNDENAIGGERKRRSSISTETTSETTQSNTPKPPAPQAPGASGSKATAISLAAWLSNMKASGELPIPEDDPVFEYAEQAGIPLDMLRLCWIEFRSRYSEPGAKRYKDWRSVYRKAVRGNWLKLWFCNADGYTLTTAGLQAQRALQAKEGAAA